MTLIRVMLYILLLSTVTMALGSRLTGVVTDGHSGQPLAGAHVLIEASDRGAATAEDGRFLLDDLPAGSLRLRISHIGYQSRLVAVTISEDQDRDLHIELRVRAVEMPAVSIVRDAMIGGSELVREIPGAVHYLDHQTLETHSYNDINRTLREIPGVNLQEEDGYGLRPNIGFRGSGSERSQKITLMEDGVLIAPAPYAAPAAYYFPTVGRMNAIEVRMGSSQIKYGPHTTGGALNLISTPITNGRHASLRLSAGTGNAGEIHALTGTGNKYWGIVAETFQTRNDGFKALDGGGNTGFRKQDYLVKVRLNNDPAAKLYSELQIKTAFVDEHAHETYLGLSDADFRNTPLRRYAGSQQDIMDADHQLLNVRHFLRIGPRLDITTTAYGNRFHRNWYKLDRVRDVAGAEVSIGELLRNPLAYPAAYDVITGGTSANEDALLVKANNRDYLSRGVQSMLTWQADHGRYHHFVEMGVRYHHDEVDRFQWVDSYRMASGEMLLTNAGVPGTDSNRLTTARAFAGYLQYTAQYLRLTIIPGIRYEHIELQRDDFGQADVQRSGAELSTRENGVSVWVPGIGVKYDLNASLVAFVGVHKGFSPPGTGSGSQPEESLNMEGGLRWQHDALRVDGVVFVSDYRNLLGADLNASGGSGSGELFNGGAVDVNGLEISASYDLGHLLSIVPAMPVRLAYTYSSATFGSDFASEFDPWGEVAAGDELPYLPPHQLFVGLGVHWKRVSLDMGAKYVDRMRAVAGHGPVPAADLIEDHIVFDLAMELRFADRQRLFLTARNLGDTRYVAARRPAGIRPGLPRTIQLGLQTAW